MKLPDEQNGCNLRLIVRRVQSWVILLGKAAVLMQSLFLGSYNFGMRAGLPRTVEQTILSQRIWGAGDFRLQAKGVHEPMCISNFTGLLGGTEACPMTHKCPTNWTPQRGMPELCRFGELAVRWEQRHSCHSTLLPWWHVALLWNSLES